ncbi:hypothetical protein LTS09_018226, partial [Friedmanniomyces endolithicus]
VLEAFGCFYEAAVSLMAIWLVWDLHTSMDNKVVVVAAFGFRLGMIIIVGLRLASFNEKGFATNPTLLQAQFIVWTSTELNYSLVSATIPIVRPFVNNLSTNYGGGQGSGSNNHTSRSGGNYVRAGEGMSDNGTFEMSSMPRSKRQRNSDLQGLNGHVYGVRCYGVQGGGQQPGTVGNGHALKTVNGDTTSVGSNDSEKMIIRKDVTWHVGTDSSIL